MASDEGLRIISAFQLRKKMKCEFPMRVRLTRGAEIDRERDLAKEALMPKTERVEKLKDSRVDSSGVDENSARTRKRGTEENEFVV